MKYVLCIIYILYDIFIWSTDKLHKIQNLEQFQRHYLSSRPVAFTSGAKHWIRLKI